MHRWLLRLKNGFSMVEGDGWGRFLGNDGYAFDLNEKEHSNLIKRTRNEGERCVAAGMGTKGLLSDRPALEM